jgi:hypothetical protein
MLWIPQRRILFIHNPKCAGTAIHNAIYSQYPNCKTYWGRFYSRRLDRVLDLTHLTIQDAASLFGLRSPLRSFGFVRNPYTRFLSSYHHFKRHNPHYENLTIEALALDLLDEERIREDWKFVHFAPQYRFFFIDNQQQVDYLWRVEDLPAVWRQVQEAFGFKRQLDAENTNMAIASDGMPVAVCHRINQLYARDFQLFRYDVAHSGHIPNQLSPIYPQFVALWPEHRSLDASDLYRR